MMTQHTTRWTIGRFDAGALVHQTWRTNRLLTIAGLVHLAVIPLILVAALLDPQTILGQPAWVKPLKFAISGAVYLFTFGFLLTYVQGWPRLKGFAANATGVALLVETALITMQVVRGRASHFNFATSFDAMVFNIMGSFIVLVAVLNLLLALALLIQRLPDPVMAWGLRLGVISAFAGMAVAFLMTQPTPTQRAQLASGQPATVVGAHSVGVEDGGPGLPLVGWSTEGGDLRIPHFVGLHGMQVLPLVGWRLTQSTVRRRLPARHRLALVWIAGAGYLGLTALLTWQALRGQPLIAPDLMTGSALAMLVATVLLGVATVWMHGERKLDPAPVRGEYREAYSSDQFSVNSHQLSVERTDYCSLVIGHCSRMRLSIKTWRDVATADARLRAARPTIAAKRDRSASKW
jgi:hypothetical protein